MDAENLRQEQHRMHGRLLLRAAVILAIAILIKYGGSVIFAILLPFVAAYLVAAILNVPIRWLERRFGATRNAGSIVISVILVGLVAAIAWRGVSSILQEAERFIASWDTMELDVVAMLQDAGVQLARLLGKQDPAFLETMQVRIEQVVLWAVGWLADQAKHWTLPAERAGDVLSGIANLVISVTVFLLAAFYLMTDYPKMHQVAQRYLPQVVLDKLRILRGAAARSFGGYFKAEFLLSAGAGVITSISLMIYGQSFAILLGIVVCIVDFIPILGSSVILMPWACVLLLTGNLYKAIFLTVLCAGIFLLRRLLEPKVVGNQTGLPTLLSLLCIYVGMVWGGILGMVFVPSLCLMVIDMKQNGFFDGTISDLKQLFREMSTILHGAKF